MPIEAATAAAAPSEPADGDAVTAGAAQEQTIDGVALMTDEIAQQVEASDGIAEAPTQPSVLVPQQGRPSLPMRVPVVADCGGMLIRGDVLSSTNNVLLLQGPPGALPALGTQVRLHCEWDGQMLNGRIAAHGVAGRFLVSMGDRAIRRSRRVAVDLAGSARSSGQSEAVAVRVVDLSPAGARVEGINQPVGSEVQLSFTPPSRRSPINVLAFVVRAIDGANPPTVGLAFRLVQPSTDLLAAS